ncbi:hypothetical protein BD560DRAFT_456078 [Blakeslea trispora]|nr:hypothetical protein BD560DRAFT_456078 [Blakeslea trispora]
MPPSSTSNRKLSNPSPTRNQLVERSSILRGCEPCKSRKQICNGQRPCTHCKARQQDCVYSVVSDHPRSVFTTSTARRLSSGSACETCRRRKTKCDGGSPCSFCASSGIECINNSERRKRSASSTSSSSSPLSTSSTINTSSAPSASDTTADNEAIDRIEDRLRRIEKLMTAFTPSPLSQTSGFANEIHDLKRLTAGFRKLSSPHLQRPPLPVAVRQHRHSIQGVSPNHRDYNNDSLLSCPLANHTPHIGDPSLTETNQPRGASPSPPLSPSTNRQNSSNSASVMANSMLNLSLSPSSSSTSSSSCMQPSVSTPTSPLSQFNQSRSSHTNDSWNSEWLQSAPIPSLMDQLSNCTFVATAMDYTTVHYPIYPISATPASKSTSSTQ